MSKNIHQVFIANPVTTNQSLDLMYFGRSPYGVTNDVAMTYANFAAQFSTSTLASGKIFRGNVSNIAVASAATYPDSTTINQLLYSSATNNITGLSTANDGTLITSAAGVPSISSTLPSAVQSNITRLGSQAIALNMNSQLINNVATPVSSGDAVNKQYADNIAAGLNPIDGVLAASTVALTVTYANGVAGVGGTLTNAGVQAAFAIDGYTASLNDRILIKNQASTFQNGIYTVTTLGSGATNWVLTRATDYDTSTEISAGDLLAVQNGTVNAGSTWLQTATVTVIGTDPITFSVFFLPANFVSSTLATGKIFRGNGSNIAVATTASFADTYTASNLLYSNGSNNVAGLATANNGLLVTNATGVPSILAGPGTTGNFLQSNAAVAPSWSASTLTLGGNFTTSGAFTTTFTITGNTSVTFPTSGTLATTASTSGRLLNVQVFTASGSNTYTPTAGVNNALVKLWGGGGGGGGSTSATQCGGAGGAGGYAESYVAVSGAVTIVVGTGGNGVVSNNNGSGTNGADTTYNSTTIVAKGGSLGTGGAGGAGGAGGVVGTGTISMPGSLGGTANSGNNNTTFNSGAFGNIPPVNNGSLAAQGTTPPNSAQGGHGGINGVASSAGATGYAIVYEYS